MDKHVAFPLLDQTVTVYIQNNKEMGNEPEIIETNYSEFNSTVTKSVYVSCGSVMARFHQCYFTKSNIFSEDVHFSWFTISEFKMFMTHLAGESEERTVVLQ